MKKVTYLFGAGASANSLPLITSLNERFEAYNSFLSYYITKLRRSDTEYSHLKGLLLGIKEHETVDTYAKKLYLQNPDIITNKEYLFLCKYPRTLAAIMKEQHKSHSAAMAELNESVVAHQSGEFFPQMHTGILGVKEFEIGKATTVESNE